MIVAVGDKRVPNAKSAGQVAHQRRKEIISGCRSGADDNGTESILRKMPIRDVADQTDDTDHLPLSVAMGRKSQDSHRSRPSTECLGTKASATWTTSPSRARFNAASMPLGTSRGNTSVATLPSTSFELLPVSRSMKGLKSW